MENNLLENLKCPICLDYANNPYECNDCFHIYCKDCLNEKNPCAVCRNTKPSFKESNFAKKLLLNIPSECPFKCENKTLTRGDIKHHINNCSFKKFICKYCKFSDKKEEFLQHILVHDKEILELFTMKESPLSVKKLINSNGDKVEKSQFNGLFYCGKEKNINCNCCDQSCGPISGCLCYSCMEFNLTFQGLIGKACLLNNEGRICYYKNKQFNCNKNKSSHLLKFFINCQENKECEACKKLTVLFPLYYSSLIQSN